VTAGTALTRVLAVARSRWARWVVGLVAVGLAVWAVAAEWTAVSLAVTRLDPPTLVLALLATVGNLLLAGGMWRAALTDLGSRLPWPVAARVYFVGQIGKYLPGSLWPVILQAELGSDHGVPRRRTATATAVALLFAVVSGVLVVLAALPFAPGVLPDGARWVVVLAVPLAVLLHPRIFGRLADLALRLAGRDPLERWTSATGTLAALAWGAGSWTCAGLQVWALAVPLGAAADLPTALLCVGGYSLAWAAGFLVFVAPAGAGAREVALAAVLSPVLDPGEIVVVVLLSRVLFTVADLAAAGLGMLLGPPTRRRIPVPGRVG
jgi:uncharacterized membrane protein YbhN (UPF0104 family)